MASTRIVGHGRVGMLPTWVTVVWVGMVVGQTSAEESGSKGLQVQWGPEHRSMTFTYLGETVSYPKEVREARFPPVGQQPVKKMSSQWPVVGMRARWTISTKGWPEKYRDQAIDLILMHTCDAAALEHMFPETIKSSRFKFPPQYLREARSPGEYNLTELMRGKEIGYAIVGKAGVGAADYTVKTKIRIGLTEDGKTFFWDDHPSYISDHLTARELVFAAHDAGDVIRFEARMLCVLKPRRLLRGEAMRRIERTGTYMVDRFYEDLDNPPTVKEIEEYFSLVQKGETSATALFKK